MHLKGFFEKKKAELVLNDESNQLGEVNQILEDLNTISVCLHHKKVAEVQRLSYNHQKKDKTRFENNILIELDFKQKITVGGAGDCAGPIQLNADYYNQFSNIRTLLGDFILTSCFYIFNKAKPNFYFFRFWCLLFTR